MTELSRCLSFLLINFNKKGLVQNDNLIVVVVVVVVVTVSNLDGGVSGVGRSKVRLSRRHANFSPLKELPEGAVGASLLSSSPADKAVVPTGTCEGRFVVIIVVIRVLEESKGSGGTSTAAARRSGKVERGWPEAVEGHRHLRSCAGSRSTRTCRSRGRGRRCCRT